MTRGLASDQAFDPVPSPRLRQFVHYAFVGAAGTLVQYALLIALVELAHWGSVAASTFGAVCGAIVNYALNHRFTFRSGRPHAHAAPRFLAVSALGLALNAIIVAAGTVAGLPYLLAQVIATGAVLLTAFTVNRRWTF